MELAVGTNRGSGAGASPAVEVATAHPILKVLGANVLDLGRDFRLQFVRVLGFLLVPNVSFRASACIVGGADLAKSTIDLVQFPVSDAWD